MTRPDRNQLRRGINEREVIDLPMKWGFLTSICANGIIRPREEKSMKIAKKTMGILVGGVAVSLLLTFGLRTGYAAALVDTYFVGFPSVSIQQNRDGSVNATIDATYVDDDATIEQFPVSQWFSTIPG